MTPEEKAAATAAEPSFATNAAGAVQSVAINAATSYERGQRDQARFWTEVGLRLVVLADSPFVHAGASLDELAQTLGVRIS